MVPIRLLPKDEKFFDLFEKAASLVREGAIAFRELARQQHDVPAGAQRIKEIEHRCDEATHETIEKLHKTFLTPIDREDIHAIITGLDEILDMLDATASRMMFYQIREIKPAVAEVSEILAQAADLIVQSVGALKDPRQRGSVLGTAREIRTLEKKADQIYRKALTELFVQERDPIAVLKWKDIFDSLEEAADRCEDLANTLEGVVVKNA